MRSGFPKGQAGHAWKVALALCCALLLIFGATVQVSHVHSAADASHASCALCATAHAVVSPAAPLAISLAARQTAISVIAKEPALARRFPYFSLYTRPPPAVIVFS